jgi:thiamine-monophosphate kinase
VLGYTLSGDHAWDMAFLDGLKDALAHYSVPLLGGDTIAMAGQRCIGMTALGQSRIAPARSGAQAGDGLYITGPIGRAGLGLRLLQGETPASLGLDDAQAKDAIAQHQRPEPRLKEGQRLAGLVHAMMDVSDGLLIDAQRMANASALSLILDISAVPVCGDAMAAMTAGDDYELLFAAPLSSVLPIPATCIGRFQKGQGLHLMQNGQDVPLPETLGWLHTA